MSCTVESCRPKNTTERGNINDIKRLATKVIWRALKDLVEGTPKQKVQAAAWLVGNDVQSMAYAAGIPISQLREISKYLALASRPEARRMLRRLVQQEARRI